MTENREESLRGYFAIGFLLALICSPTVVLPFIFGWKGALIGLAVTAFFILMIWSAGDISFSSADNGTGDRNG